MAPMGRWLKILLTAYLLLALSAQGYAQASMLACGQGQAGMAQAAAPHDHAAMMVAATLDASHPDQASHDHSQHGQGQQKHKCTHCAPCCVGSALVSEMSIAIAAPVTAQAFPALAVAAASAGGERLDRPPRSFLA